MLECVVNVSEGRDRGVVRQIARAAGHCLLDVHSDADHNRSVLTLAGATLPDATRAVAAGAHAQVSLNLLDPLTYGPAQAYDDVAGRAEVARAEVVGLVPAAVLAAVPSGRWPQLDLDPSRTIEARLEMAGLDGGSLHGGTPGASQ